MNTNSSTAIENSTKKLLNQAVNNTSIFSRKGLLDRIFTAWFDRLVYPQIWEDPEVDIDALKLNENSRIFTISSGGCNVLNYLSQQPESIDVVDLNEAHIALLKLKLCALQHLPNYESFFDFFARADLQKNMDRYQAYIRPHLDEKSRVYWEAKEVFWGKPRIHYFSDGFYRHGLLGRFIGFIHWIGRRLGYDITQVMQARTAQEQEQLFNQHVAPIFDTKLVRFLCNRSMVLYSLGIPPSQFEEMKAQSKDSDIGMHSLLKERARKLACDFPLESNYFAWQAYQRKYDTERRIALPRYLQKQNFATTARELDKVTISHKSMTERLSELPANSLNAYLFLDAQDWMSPQQLTELWQQVERTAMPGARVIFRTAGLESPLEDKLPPTILQNWHTDNDENTRLTHTDRSAIYGAVHLYIHN